MEVTMTASRMRHRLGLDRNPLRRRTDRLETWITLIVVLALVLAGPFAVWRAGVTGFRTAAAASERDSQQQRFKVGARLHVRETPS
ncbi:MAG: hypothetical protein AUI14_08775 [Actinobacteria bacterium 13_2_20CM_2_71_6]|nr:MAG: hypothetical protein AUI14_08775 [Actinobacteria bacterium 13_2_20CM_2_71_6]